MQTTDQILDEYQAAAQAATNNPSSTELQEKATKLREKAYLVANLFKGANYYKVEERGLQ